MILSTIFSAFGQAVKDGYGTSFVLMFVILVLLLVVLSMLRAYNRRLAECESKHHLQEKAYTRLQKKFAICVGVLVANMGKRDLPKTFWSIMLDDSTDEIPDIDLVAPAIQ